jgi:hypothetical protein
MKGKTLILRENGAWLRYVFWGIAIAMLSLAATAVTAPVRDVEKTIECSLGALLFGFSGFVLGRDPLSSIRLVKKSLLSAGRSDVRQGSAFSSMR